MLDRDSIIASIGDLSVTPRIIRHLSLFLKSPDADITPAVEAMKMEPVLTAAMLAACNSPTHYRGQKLLCLEHAILRLGYRETYRIALLITFRQGLRIANLPDNKVADYLWSRAITAGCAMERLASTTNAAAAYTVGLLHLVGCFILARNRCPLAVFNSTHPTAMLAAQEAAYGIAFPEAGALALEKWGFPPEIWMPIRYQLQPAETSEFSEDAILLARAVAVANFIEQCRPDSPAYLSNVKEGAYIEAFVREVEVASADLIGAFYAVPPRRPAWANRNGQR
ncbi:MAG TPA: HDOD domain-containing protein [Opitutus sp.]|nr:HDOD domain-containing protein [Opitutus sp.]